MSFKNNKLYIPVHFFADDGLILPNNRRQMERMLDLIMEVSGSCGLSINTKKAI
ncbi:hypothetical protein SK128_000339, partial [Halocaridina rubra]